MLCEYTCKKQLEQFYPRSLHTHFSLKAQLLCLRFNTCFSYDPDAYPPNYGTPDKQVLRNSQRLHVVDSYNNQRNDDDDGRNDVNGDNNRNNLLFPWKKSPSR